MPTCKYVDVRLIQFTPSKTHTEKSTFFFSDVNCQGHQVKYFSLTWAFRVFRVTISKCHEGHDLWLIRTWSPSGHSWWSRQHSALLHRLTKSVSQWPISEVPTTIRKVRENLNTVLLYFLRCFHYKRKVFSTVWLVHSTNLLMPTDELSINDELGTNS